VLKHAKPALGAGVRGRLQKLLETWRQTVVVPRISLSSAVYGTSDETRTENPRVGGSIPPLATIPPASAAFCAQKLRTVY